MRLRRLTSACISLVTASLVAATVNPAAAASAADTTAVATVDAAETADLLATLLDSEQVTLDAPTDDGVVLPEDAEEGLIVPVADSEEAGELADTVEIGLPGNAEAEVTDSGAVTYADEDGDSALLVHSVDVSDQPEIASETMTLITIGSPDASAVYPFPIDVPQGASVDLFEDGSVAVTDADGNALGVFPAPWAVDAKGQEVPTWFEVTTDNTVVQHVQHVGYAYPVIADPVWMVPVLIVGARVAIQVAVKASSSAAARTAAARAAAAQTGKKVASTGAAAKLAYKSFTSSNYRHNLIVRTGKNPSNCQAHHMVPQMMRTWAKDRGFNIDDPAHLVWWVSTSGTANNHGSKASAYNADWNKWMERYPRATSTQIRSKMNSMNNAYKQFYRC